ncbi:zinc-binding protein A33-like isoform X1 [Lampris incognitus]|uniref:zinc-binding protein A33-like isoform X1 n=1 Tax=Lampris incognitus TaxID=2546036 RepID=UPI0024B623A7|nr:zinc-binding protein A33-like isoform X1 [Lampris incognitus]
MASGSSLLSHDHLLCSVCLDVLADPVSIPCGHNFCKSCITQYWDCNVECRCPLCNKLFTNRPEVPVNTLLRDMTVQFRQSIRVKASRCPDQLCAKPGEVPCDVCTGTKIKALKSCLVCLASYCETHLDLHQKVTGLKRHRLIDPVKNLEDRICKKHEKPLDLFCRNEQVCVCQFCTESDHRLHPVVPLKEECEGKQQQLGKNKAEAQQMIQQRHLKIQVIKRSVEISKDEGFIEELEEEIRELKKRSTELEKLSQIKDHLHLLQSFSSLSTPPHTKNWTEVSVHQPSYVGTVRTAVEKLEETVSKEIEKLCETELKRVQQYEVDVTLYPDTANIYLNLSEDGKQVYHADSMKNLPDNPERISPCLGVLGKQNFSSGRFYFEVVVKEKTMWDLGVVTESVNRKGKLILCPKNGLWTIWLRNGNEYKALAGPGVLLSQREKLPKVGVFVDYEEGLVSFYDVDAGSHIYSFTGCTFTERLYPYLSPCNNDGGKNVAPLIISPVKKV